MTQRVVVMGLQAAYVLHEFVSREGLHGTETVEEEFWAVFAELVQPLSSSNCTLLRKRQKLQAEIDVWPRAQYVANWLPHGVVTEVQLMQSLNRMAALADGQNESDPNYLPMAFDDLAFTAARELTSRREEQHNGYTKLILAGLRREAKNRPLVRSRPRHLTRHDVHDLHCLESRFAAREQQSISPLGG